MATTINSNTTDGLVITPDTSGEVKIQSGGTDIVTFDSNGMNMATGMTLPADSLSGLKTINGSSIVGSGDLEVGGGKLLQATYKNNSVIASYSANNTNVPTQIGQLNTNITPISNTSKIFITFSIHGEGNHDIVFRLYRGSTEIGRNPSSSSRWSGFAGMAYDPDNASTPSRMHFTYVDEPATTSTITYNIRIQSSNGGNHTWYLNKPLGGSTVGQDSYEIGTSNVTLMEIAS
jgi:hypothetical protein